MKLLLQHKIFIGYFILMTIICSMVAIVLHERKRVTEIEQESINIFQTQSNISAVHRYITVLATFGESVMTWTDKDCELYRTQRLTADSLLQVLREQCKEFIRLEHVDSLRSLLFNKEEHLLRMQKLFRQQRDIDSLLAGQYSLVTSQVNTPRTVIRKKKGIAGFFGGKEIVQLPSVNTKVKARGNELISLQEERRRNIETYTDSLRLHNHELNQKLRTLITNLDDQALFALRNKEIRLKDSYEYSTLVITSLIIFSIILLVFSYLIIQRDIREKAKTRKRLEETIEQNTALLEMRKNIILTMSHDIRAPLNIISGNAELAMDTRERKRRNIYLDNIRIVCRHVVHLLNNLLDVYRLNEAKEIRNDVPFSLHELMERTASGFSHVVNNKGILFDCDFKNTEVRLYGDADRIEQIIDNLLTNAVKFTKSGTIGFHARYHKGELVLEIKDTGIGMTEETLSRIFRPFERRTSAANADGYGLGLPITQGLVNLLDGRIEVTSSIDRGSTFRVTLPLPETDEPLVSENRTQPCPEHLPHNVLVIDDDGMLRDVIKEMLERNGVACTVCSTAKEVVKAMRGKDYDLLLSDIQMPGTNGFELLALLHSSNIGNSRTIPVVAMTARGDREKDAFLTAGFTACIYKPFSSPELLGLLSTVKKCRKDDGKGFDFSVMLSETSDKAGLLRSFIIQSEKDLEELSSGMNDGDRHKLRETVHRMLPMWELLQIEDALSAYRTLLKDDTAIDDAVREHTRQIMECTAMLIAEAENEIKRQTNEKENTDS